MPSATEVVLEVGHKRVFATAVEWPGWCRSGRDEAAALEALGQAAGRYAEVAARAGVSFPARAAREFTVIERVPGDATTDYGAPNVIAERDRTPLTAAQARRRADLLVAAWAFFDDVVAGAPAELAKGPRGGGRDRDEVVAHVIGAEALGARKLGVKLPAPASLVEAAPMREAIVAALRDARDGTPVVAKGWPPRHAGARITWHVLDHAWEIQDKS
jgi:hypothetical protein